MKRKRIGRCAFALVGAIIGCRFEIAALRASADTLMCDGDCATIFFTCCANKYHNHYDCLTCCENTFGAYAPSGCFNESKLASCKNDCPQQ
jgi:hypothetical protein